MAMRFVVLICLIEISVAVHQGLMNLYKKSYNGDGTYYGNTVEGTCSYTPPDLPPAAKHSSITDLVALNRPQFFNSLSCGMCFRVYGNDSGLGNDPIKGHHLVFVKDLCPECHIGAVDFAKNGDGRWAINIQAVQCPVGNTHIAYKFQGSNPWYLKLQVRNARIPAYKVEMFQPSHNQWAQFHHEPDNFWTTTSAFDKPVVFPMHIRLTAANGRVIEDYVSHLANDEVIHGNNKQFPLDPSLGQ